jgi:DNA polymerase-3 subunit gamma/tau
MMGQQHIIRTLSNAIDHDRLAHAYIFSGPRGTGKTSSARILAKSLNCRNGKSITPCGTCDLCQKITLGQSVDIIEIDAASNTGVDNIRVLNDQVAFAPVECRYRMFIIDEAHMLSTGAFNALLKTLEEPPAHVIFILATTESHKIPATIQSRCQHLQFRKLSIDEIVAQLRHIATGESITVSDDALRVIARNSAGCMRDGISLFDQLFSFCGAQISDADVQSTLGAAGADQLGMLASAMLDQKGSEVIAQSVALSQAGTHPTQLLEDLVALFKDVLFLELGYSAGLDQGRERLILTLKGKAPTARLQSIIELLSRTQMDLRYFPDPQLLVQIRCVSAIADSQSATVAGLEPKPAAGSVSVPSPGPGAPATDHLQRLKAMQVAAMEKTVTPAVPSPPPASPPPPEPRSVDVTGLNDAAQWDTVLKRIKEAKQSLFTILNQSQLISLNRQSVTIKLKQDFLFFREKVREAHSQAIIDPIFRQVFGFAPTLRFEGESLVENAVSRPSPVVASPAAEPVSSRSGGESDTKIKKINHIIALFEGAIVEN